MDSKTLQEVWAHNRSGRRSKRRAGMAEPAPGGHAAEGVGGAAMTGQAYLLYGLRERVTP